MCVGMLLGFFIAYFFIKKKEEKKIVGISSSCGVHMETTNPLYDEIRVSELTSSQKIDMGENVAYGPVVMR